MGITVPVGCGACATPTMYWNSLAEKVIYYDKANASSIYISAVKQKYGKIKKEIVFQHMQKF
jgi:hypothetical protein